ncbi:MAG: hypothetical protein ABJM58_06875 [Alteripontixanthobacter sp.]
MLCKFFDPAINRRRVWHDGLEFRTNCDRCGAELIRGEQGWREFDAIRDDDPERKPHPNTTETSDIDA